MSAASGHTPPRSSHSSSSSSSASNSISLVQVDELSSFGATKQKRLPALIKLNPLGDSQQQQQQQVASSMPEFAGSEVEKMAVTANSQAESMPGQLVGADKENSEQQQQQQRQPMSGNATSEKQRTASESDDFQVVDMDEEESANGASNGDLMGPSLPAPSGAPGAANGDQPAPSAHFTSTSFSGEWDAKSLSAQLQSSHLGDSLIEMIINLRNENQNLVRALETNNEYVKERLQEFKRCQEEAKRREAQHALEKAELEHQTRKLRRQNEVLSERLKSLEGKLKELNAEVGDTLEAAHSSKASSVRADSNELYPELAAADESFSNSALASQNQQPTLRMEPPGGELLSRPEAHASSSGSSSDDMDGVEQQPRAPAASNEEAAKRLAAMSKDELAKHFDATKAHFYSLDDPMKQCDQLEKQLNDIGRRDYEICLLQQQLNIYRQDFRLERMAKLEAKIQIEKLKADIDRLCLERVQEQRRERDASNALHFGPASTMPTHHSAPGGGAAAGANLIGKLGHHLSKKAVRSAAKAAKYAAKQAHLEEKAAAALARAQAARATAAQFYTTPKTADSESGPQRHQTSADSTGDEQFQQQQQQQYHHHHHRGHHQHSSAGGRPHRSGRAKPGLGSEVVNDLLSTANKAMLTGYKMASTHANLVLDKLSQFEQQQAAQLDPKHKPPIQQTQPSTIGKSACAPSAPPMDSPSID